MITFFISQSPIVVLVLVLIFILVQNSHPPLNHDVIVWEISQKRCQASNTWWLMISETSAPWYCSYCWGMCRSVWIVRCLNYLLVHWVFGSAWWLQKWWWEHTAAEQAEKAGQKKYKAVPRPANLSLLLFVTDSWSLLFHLISSASLFKLGKHHVILRGKD